jgi:hypothetical protein
MTWTHNQVRGAIWTLEHLIGLARLSVSEADAVMGLILPKLVAHSGLSPATFREIIQAMDPDEELLPLTQH